MIEASRAFVCVRIDSYESEENQQIVRSHLGGRFENTAFCVLAPDGEQRLTRSGRGPHQVSRDFDGIAAIARRFRPEGDPADSRVPDFGSFALALNVAAADQRLLVLIAGGGRQVAAAEKRLRAVAWSEEAIGRFHYDHETDAANWSKVVSGRGAGEPGVHIIRPDPFGLEGEIVESLPFAADRDRVGEALARANRAYAETTERKVYSDHVRTGRRDGKRIEMAMEFGEDRDGDGVIDHRGGGGGGRPPRPR